jgi:probable HAF family extracellular repeat protein
MKSRFLMLLTAITLFAALAMPFRLAAQDSQESSCVDPARKHDQHHHYKLIDLGTLGGPQSFGGGLNNQGTVAGEAETATPDPFYPNANPLINTWGPDPFVYHAFETKNGALVDLGALPGTNSSFGGAPVNGSTVGASINSTIDPLTGWPEETAVLWKAGQVINLGTLGGYESAAFSVNSRGQVAGFSGNSTPDPYSFLGLGTETRAFRWQSGQMQDLGTLGGPDAFGGIVNERGQITGLSYTNSVPNPVTGLPTTHPFLWNPTTMEMEDLGTLGGTYAEPWAINDAGQVVGYSTLAGDLIFHPFLWDPETRKMQDLGTFGGAQGIAQGINEAGEPVGWATYPGDQVYRAFLWRHGRLVDLGVVGGAGNSFTGSINSSNQVVGQMFPSGDIGDRAFLWENGQIIDLNVFVPPDSDLILGDAQVINDRGEISGNATLPNGDVHAFLLIPCDENLGDDYDCRDASTTRANQSVRGPVTQNTIPLTQGSLSRSKRMSAIRVRSAHRYPYRGFGTYQPK